MDNFNFENVKFGTRLAMKNGQMCIYWGKNIAFTNTPANSAYPYYAIAENGLLMYDINGVFCANDHSYDIDLKELNVEDDTKN